MISGKLESATAKQPWLRPLTEADYRIGLRMMFRADSSMEIPDKLNDGSSLALRFE
jgi:hypothetical protein